MTDDERKQLRAAQIVSRTKMLPGTGVGGALWHVCGVKPYPNALNVEGKCFKCGCAVYYSDPRPELKKICIRCALPMVINPATELVVNKKDLDRAARSIQKNIQKSN